MKQLLVAVCGLFIMASHVGCVATNSIRELRKDNTIPPTRSVVFWKVRITDRTRTLAHGRKERIPRLYFKRLDVDNYGSSRDVSPCPVKNDPSGQATENGWMKTNDSDRFDGLMAISLDPGRYHMRTLFFPIDHGAARSDMPRLSIPVNRLIKIMPDKLYYLGSFNVVVERIANGECLYSFAIDSDDSRQADMENFTSNFPDLSKSFGDKPVLNRPLAYYSYDFSYDIKIFPDFIRTNEVLAEINLDKKGRSYIIQRFSEDEGYHYVTGKRAHNLSSGDSFTIEWESKWVEGVNHLPYGLLLGTNPQNAYYFAVSGNEKSAVFLKRNDIWLNRPCDWKNGTAKAGDGVTSNHHKVEFSGNRITYSVNDKNIAEFDNSLAFDSFVVGLFVAGKESIVFDDIIIEQKTTPPQS